MGQQSRNLKRRIGAISQTGRWTAPRRVLAHLLRIYALLALTVSPVRAESLREALASAYSENPAIQAERSRQRADDEAVPQAISGWLPKASVDAEAGRTRSRKRQPHYTRHHQPQRVNLSVSQPLFSGFRTLNGKRQAISDVRAGREELYQTEQAVLLDTVTAYMDVIRDREIARLRLENVNFLKTELKATQTRQREGDLSKTDVAQARSRYHEGEASLAQARANAKSSEANYEAIVGHRPGRLARPPSIRRLSPKSIKAALAAAGEENPIIIAAEFREDSARFALKKAYGEFMPTVSLDAEHGRDFDHLVGVNQEDDSSLYVRLSMPLYQGGTLSSQVREARETYRQRKYEAADTRNQITASVHDAWQQLRAAKQRVRSDELQVNSAGEALKGVKIEADVGERAIFEVLDAQRELINARVSRTSAQRDVVVSRYNLLASVGRLSAYHLELPVYLYDPTVNLRRIKFRPFSGVINDPAGRDAGLATGDYEYEMLETVAPPPAEIWAKPDAMPVAPAKSAAGSDWTASKHANETVVLAPEADIGTVVAVQPNGAPTGAVMTAPAQPGGFEFDWGAD